MQQAGFVVLTLEFRKEGGYWIGECRELGTATDGRSLDRVERELSRLVELLIGGLEEIGEHERLFRERGITLYTDHPPRQLDAALPVVDGGAETLVQLKSVPVPLNAIAATSV
ncbi:MAG TPA: hypothetical protein VH916_00800 [Dehalococcoidia bacterium]|jgi:predicted RNase H-like HicB family nuclease